MAKTNSRRIALRKPTPEARRRVQRYRARIARELPDLVARDQMRKEARDEPTLSGELRRAVHASAVPLSTIASESGITMLSLDEFLTGERTLRSDVLDRLAKSLGYQLTTGR